jgi:hypothetical protein
MVEIYYPYSDSQKTIFKCISLHMLFEKYQEWIIIIF